jgi:hypothetical protein
MVIRPLYQPKTTDGNPCRQKSSRMAPFPENPQKTKEEKT